MSASPASYISRESSSRLPSRSPNATGSTGSRIQPRSSIQKHTKSRSGCKTCKKRKVKVSWRRMQPGRCRSMIVKLTLFLNSATRSVHHVGIVSNTALIATLPCWSAGHLILSQPRVFLLSISWIWSFSITSPPRPITRSQMTHRFGISGRVPSYEKLSIATLSCVLSLPSQPHILRNTDRVKDITTCPTRWHTTILQVARPFHSWGSYSQRTLRTCGSSAC